MNKRIVVFILSLILAVVACAGPIVVTPTSTPQGQVSKLQPVTSTPIYGGRRADETPTYGGVLITPEAVVAWRKVVVVAEILRVRACPSTNCEVLEYLHQGDVIDVAMERSGNNQCSTWLAYRNGWVCQDWTVEYVASD